MLTFVNGSKLSKETRNCWTIIAPHEDCHSRLSLSTCAILCPSPIQRKITSHLQGLFHIFNICFAPCPWKKIPFQQGGKWNENTSHVYKATFGDTRAQNIGLQQWKTCCIVLSLSNCKHFLRCMHWLTFTSINVWEHPHESDPWWHGSAGPGLRPTLEPGFINPHDA